MSLEQYSVSDYAQAFRRRAKVIVLVFAVIAAAAAIVAFSLPDVYTSRAEFRVDLQGPNINELRSVEMTNYADQYVRSLEQQVLSWENRRRWLEENPDLYAADRGEVEQSELISRMGANASVQIITTSVLERTREVSIITGFRPMFQAPNPEGAHFVADKMVQAFLAADRAERTSRAETATSFFEQEIEQKRKEIQEIESEIATFKEEHSGLLPEMRAFNMSSLERAERDLESVESEIQNAQQDLIFRRAQLEEMRSTSGSAERLRQLEDEYLQAVSIYGPDHPDVLRIRRQVAALTGAENSSGNTEIGQAEAELASLRERYSEQHPDVVSARRRLETLRAQQEAMPDREPTDLRYLQLTAQINATETRLSGLRERADELRSRINEMESRLSRMPQVEREYQALQRDLETARLAFDDLRQRTAQARQTEAFESGERGARISLVSSANRPSQPSGPPRAAIVVLGLMVASTFSVGAGIGAEAMDGTVRGAKDIYRLFETRPLATIPVVQNTTSQAQRRRKRIVIALAGLAVIAALFAVYSIAV